MILPTTEEAMIAAIMIYIRDLDRQVLADMMEGM